MSKVTGKRSSKSKKDEEPEEDEETTPDHGKKSIVGALESIEDWEDTEETSFSEVPEGKYQVKIESATINHSKSSGRLQCSWQMVIESGPQKNRKVFKHDGLEDEQQRGFFRGALAKLGVEWPKNPRDLPDCLDELIDTFAQITVKKKDEYTNVYFDKALDSDDVDETRHVVEEEEVKPKKNGKKKEEEEEEEEEKEVEEKEKEEEEEEEEGVSLKSDKIDKAQTKEVNALAKENDFEADDYDKATDMLCDVAEHLGVSGEYKDVASLLTACKKKSK